MRTFNLSSALANLHYYYQVSRLMVFGATFLIIITFIVYSFDKEVERIGVGEVIECSPIKNNFFIGSIHKANVRVQGEVIENVRLIDCVKKEKVLVTKKHKHWGFKGHYAARYVRKKMD